MVSLVNLNINVFPNPSSDLIAIQIGGLVENNMEIELMDMNSRVVASTQINAGQTIAYFDISTVYAGTYFIKISSGDLQQIRKVVVQ